MNSNTNSPRENRDSPVDRRGFLKQAIGAGATAGVALTAAALLYKDAEELLVAGPSDSAGKKSVKLGSFAVDRPADALRLAIVHGEDPLALFGAGLGKFGGMEEFIRKGDTVVVKPNVAFASPPLVGATTNPDLVEMAVRLSLRAGAKRVIVTDNPINQPERAFAQTGIGPAARVAGAEVIIPTESSFGPITVKGARYLRKWPFLYEPFARADKVVGIAPVKDHSRASASMAMKNWYGLLGGRRNQFHQDIHNIIKELAMMITPTLVILDGTQVMMRNGPTGGSVSDLARKNTLIVATDQVAADAVGYTLLDRDPAQLQYLQLATDLELGTRHFRQIPYVEFNVG